MTTKRIHNTNVVDMFFCRITYELVVMKGHEINESMTPVLKRETALPPILINPSDLGGEETAGEVYTMGVRVKSKAVSVDI